MRPNPQMQAGAS